MTYADPTAAEFKVRHPKFAAADDALVDLILAESTQAASQEWTETDYRAAVMLLTAHTLVSEGALGDGPPSAAAGQIKKTKAGEVEVEFDVAASRMTGDGTLYGGTTYGRQYLAIRNKYAAGVVLWV